MMYARFLLCFVCVMLAVLPGLASEAAVPDVGPIKSFDLPDNEATRFACSLGAGWNLGNTFDAHADHFRGNPMDLEGYWCGVKTSREMIHTLREAGFSTVRIPISWHNHVQDDFTVDTAWMDRIQTVVDWCMEEGMYVIINTHHDEGEAYFYPDKAHEASSLAYLSAIWQQMADRFRDYDEHLIMESMNEPRPKGTSVEWWYDPTSPLCRESAEVINTLNQRFVDIVRSSGGKNADRFLMVPGYDASPEGVLNDVFTLPSDTAAHRLLVAVHAYTPYDFALNRTGTSSFSAQNQNDRSSVAGFMNRLYEAYVAKGIPVVIGEYGALDKHNLQDRVDFFAFYVASASARHMPCLVWDNNAFTGNGECFGFLDRRTCTFPYPAIIEAIMTYRMK